VAAPSCAQLSWTPCLLWFFSIEQTTNCYFYFLLISEGKLQKEEFLFLFTAAIFQHFSRTRIIQNKNLNRYIEIINY
jgi:hypothetical protein